MKRQIGAVLFVLFGMLLAASFVFADDVKNKDADDNTLYVCACGTCSKCATGVSKKPGKCGCGNELVPAHVLKVEGKEAIVCSCGKECKCQINDKDATKCGCGKPAKRVNIEGLYVCNCADPKCLCTISDKPGECRCGKPLKKVQ